MRTAAAERLGGGSRDDDAPPTTPPFATSSIALGHAENRRFLSDVDNVHASCWQVYQIG
jgi:hypothetical protein